MNIAYFSNQFADAQGHGISRYARQLYHALEQSAAGPQVHPVAAWSSLEKAELDRYQDEAGLKLLSMGRRLTPLAWTFLNWPPLETMLDTPVDLVHAVSLGYPIATHKPLVVTVHDLGPLTHPEYFTNTRPWIMRRSLERTLSRASRIICVSNTTANELLQYAGTDVSDRLEVVHEGVSGIFTDNEAESALPAEGMPAQGEPYILCTGKISPRKNLAGVIRAFAHLADSIEHHLVLVGAEGWDSDEVYNLAGAAHLEHRIHFPGFVPDTLLRQLYSQASAYVHPSLYEGFGLTILEAMTCGCPVITSNRSSLPEVAGDAALLVDPTDTHAIAGAIFEVCTDENTATELRRKGKQQAARFSWERCAKETAEIYQQVLA